MTVLSLHYNMCHSPFDSHAIIICFVDLAEWSEEAA